MGRNRDLDQDIAGRGALAAGAAAALEADLLAVARRVLRAGGSAVFAEPDWDTLIIDYPTWPSPAPTPAS